MSGCKKLVISHNVNRKVLSLSQYFDFIYVISELGSFTILNYKTICKKEFINLLECDVFYFLIIDFEDYNFYNEFKFHKNFKTINYSESLMFFHDKRVFRRQLKSLFNSDKYDFIDFSPGVANLNSLNLPLYFKPAYSSGSRGNFIVHDFSDLNGLKVSGVIENYLNFSYTGGVGIYAVDGDIIAYQINKRILTYPTSGGVSVLGGLNDDENVNDLLISEAKSICSNFGLSGLFMLEFGILGDSNIYWIECNSRLWGSFEFLLNSSISNPVGVVLRSFGVIVKCNNFSHKFYGLLHIKSFYIFKVLFKLLCDKIFILKPYSLKDFFILFYFKLKKI